MSDLITLGTDFSPHAARAAEVACAFAARERARVLLIHAREGTSGDEGRLRAEAERLSALTRDVAVEPRLEAGIPDEVLSALTGDDQAKMVVVGALGRRDPARWVLGSVAERTAETSRAPVLIVRDAAPLLAWLRGERRLRVVLGFDFSEASTEALAWINTLERLGPCDVVVGHVMWPPEEHKRPSGQKTGASFATSPDLETVLRSDVGRAVRKHVWRDTPQVRVKLVSGRRAPALAALAAEERADLLVIGSRHIHGQGRLWQEAISRGALFHATMSVACVPVGPRAKAPKAEAPVDQDEVSLARRLEAHPFLRGASGNVLHRLVSISREMVFERGASLFKEGGEAKTLFLVERGLVALEIDVIGRGQTQVESVREGDVVGLSWLFPPYRWHLDGKAIEPTSVLAVDAERLRTWMKEDPEIAEVMASRLVSRLYERLERMRMRELDLYRGGS